LSSGPPPAGVSRSGEAELDDRPYEPKILDDEARLWTRRTEQNKAKLASYNQQIRHVEAEMATKSADREALEVRLAVAKELEGMRAFLMQKEIGSKVNYLDAKGQRLQIEREMQLAANNVTELEQELERDKAEKATYLAEFRQKTAEELVQARRDHDAAVKQLDKAARRNDVTVLTAPEDAIVLDVAQHSVGSVMKEAEALYTLAPRRRRQSMTARLPLHRTRSCGLPRSAPSGCWRCGTLYPASKGERKSATATR
jgi:hemolysin D